MTKRDPSLRLKVKRDTFFLPDSDGSVYFRNNMGSFRMEGGTIDQWIEQLLPMFTGAYTLAELTDGLPDEYRDRVFEIADSLLRNGFVQDVSRDWPYQLTDKVLEQYGPQIEFLSSLADSGAYRFMRFRQARVAAVGAGPFLVSLAGALLDCGLPRFHLLMTDELPTNRERLAELIAHARSRDPEVAVEELAWRPERTDIWREAVQPFEAILYVSQTGNLEELRKLHAICREEGKVFVPAICFEQTGVAGPLVTPDSPGCWESAWRRIHQSALADKDPQLHAFSAAAGAMLANVIVFEWFKNATDVNEPGGENQLFLLDLETLEGSWHPYAPHPLVTGHPQGKQIADLAAHLEATEATAHKPDKSGLISFFSTLASAVTGMFHRWEEGELVQLPLSQCFIQAADPLGAGPAGLLPEMVCSGMTHEEARAEAGLAGIEAYVSRLIEAVRAENPVDAEGERLEIEPGEFVGIGAGDTAAEAVCRALQRCLSEEWRTELQEQVPSVTPVQLEQVEDPACRFYLQALATLQEEPVVGWGTALLGFPVVWIEAGGTGYGSVGLNVTMALRTSLQLALLQAQNREHVCTPYTGERAALLWADQEPLRLEIPACEETWHREAVLSAVQTLQQQGKRLVLWELAMEPAWQGELAGVIGAVLREEGAR